jgi:hypothetical protein
MTCGNPMRATITVNISAVSKALKFRKCFDNVPDRGISIAAGTVQ